MITWDLPTYGCHMKHSMGSSGYVIGLYNTAETYKLLQVLCTPLQKKSSETLAGPLKFSFLL